MLLCSCAPVLLCSCAPVLLLALPVVGANCVASCLPPVRRCQVGQGAGAGFNVNVAWSCGNMGDAEYVAAFQQVLMPIATQFNPELVLISAGFDAADGDPLGGCSITPAGTRSHSGSLTSAPVVLC